VNFGLGQAVYNHSHRNEDFGLYTYAYRRVKQINYTGRNSLPGDLAAGTVVSRWWLATA
jgi:hypothetical protein